METREPFNILDAADNPIIDRFKYSREMSNKYPQFNILNKISYFRFSFFNMTSAKKKPCGLTNRCGWLMKIFDNLKIPVAGLPCVWRWLQLSTGTRRFPCGCSHRPPSVAFADLHHTCPSLHQPEEANIREPLLLKRLPKSFSVKF